MARLVLTERRIAALKAGPHRIFLTDAVVPGLVLDCTPNGHKSYMLRARYPGGRTAVRRLIGECGTMTLDQARAEARRWLEMLRQGCDPKAALAEQRRQVAAEQGLTFGFACEAFFAQRLRGRHVERTRQEIERELLSRWRERPLSGITRGDVVTAVEAVRARGRLTAGNRASGSHARCIFNHIRAIFNFAVLRFDLPASPCDRLKPANLGLVFKPRERVLNDNEIKAAWGACDVMGYPFGPLVKLLIMGGVRKSEASASTWREFDLTAKVWTIPAARFKSGSEHHVPLTDDMIGLLSTLPRFQSGDFVFSTCYGRKPVNGFSKCASRLLKLMRLELGNDMKGFCLHDLRRTMRTRLSEIGISETVAEQAIGHSKRGLLRIYDQYRHGDEIRSALERWHRRLRDILDPPAPNVVPLRA